MQKKKVKHVIAFWFIFVVLLPLLPSMVFTTEMTEETTISTEDWDISRSKTATE